MAAQFSQQLRNDRRRPFLGLFFVVAYYQRMSTLFHRRYLACPYDRARRALEESLRDFVVRGEPEPLWLRVPLPGSDGNGPGLEKEVLVTYGLGKDPLHFDQPWTVHWSPTNGGPFPDFNGTVTVRADEDYTTSVIELRGTYEPPLGAPGALFDAVVGSRVASATARELLREVGSRIEDRYHKEEEAKAAP